MSPWVVSCFKVYEYKRRIISCFKVILKIFSCLFSCFEVIIKIISCFKAILKIFSCFKVYEYNRRINELDTYKPHGAERVNDQVNRGGFTIGTQTLVVNLYNIKEHSCSRTRQTDTMV